MNVVHGGDVERVARTLGVAPDELLDFSANINPLGPPAAVLDFLRNGAADVEKLTRYPDTEAAVLRAAIGAYLGISPDSVVVANGSAALIDAVATMLRPAHMVLTAPAFSEYTRVARAHRVGTLPIVLRAEDDFQLHSEAAIALIEQHRPALTILTNPHNPSGALLDRGALLRIADAVGTSGGHLVVDEAFIDYAEGESLASEAAASGVLVVLRSLTKMFAMPALRVGYAVTAPCEAAHLRLHVPAWPISSLAAEAALRALGDRDFVRRSLAVNAIERERLAAALRACGLVVFPSQANFLLVRLPSAAPASTHLRAALIERYRIIVRDCADFEGLDDRFVRVAVRSRDENARLLAALHGVFGSLD